MSDEYNQKLDEMEHAVNVACGQKSMVYYSAYNMSKSTGNPLNNLNQIAVRGKVIMSALYDDFWLTGDEGKDYQSEIVEDPTWLEMAVLAEAMIRTTSDTHHCFLEGVYPAKKKIDGIKVYNFSMGS